ncbi:alginate lyase family protein [Membranihabitans maritimus]|uniref:alginate lyase family protein n=1 Tax=Membranihabitans maritimus TaxID=2904244 RepID=UPI001F2B7423|nr:alginate lyase family protein [Membranihabitans maritimus]
MLNKLGLLLPLLLKLGYRNVAYMVWYKSSLKLGWRRRKFPLGSPIPGPFFTSTATIANYPKSWKTKTLEKANNILEGKLTWFNYHNFQVDNPPNWFRNPFDGTELQSPHKHWTALSDFDLNTGDIKILWEPSRFDWLTDLARAYRITGEKKYLLTLNEWLQHWSQYNPLNQGPNWKCGQETAIRVMKLITTSHILEQDTCAAKNLKRIVYEHLERIEGNINYAITQNNNHGTSEAAGLYIGATWLMNQDNNETTPTKLQKWKKRGRKILENRIQKLIAPQGTFAQRSLTYHRVVVDTMSWTLYAMEKYNEPTFSKTFARKLEKLGEWQYKMMASKYGDAPNIGANDGAMFETLHNCDYRDFRPSIQLFFGVLKKQRVFDDGHYDEALFWRYPKIFHTFKKHIIEQPDAEILDHQFLIMRADETKIILKIPNNKFRPSACDAFHLDLWHKNENLLGDSGTYSYNGGEESEKYKSVEAHNTVQFGKHEQMPKISRFLYGKWLKCTYIKKPILRQGTWIWEGSYSDSRDNVHTRKLEWFPHKNILQVTDTLNSLIDKEKKIFWHSISSKYSNFTIQVKNAKDEKLQGHKRNSYKSLYYMNKSIKETYWFATQDKIFKTRIQYG